jgi:hypothetical protein
MKPGAVHLDLFPFAVLSRMMQWQIMTRFWANLWQILTPDEISELTVASDHMPLVIGRSERAATQLMRIASPAHFWNWLHSPSP